jgi:Rps23 Pro-64 3,4-dihydroxylase Tpa1-like proline 4-hydroxylase
MEHKLNFSYIANNIDAAVIDNFYTQEQLDIVLNECVSLIPVLMPPEMTASATGSNNEFIKNNHGAFIDESTSKIVDIDYTLIRNDSIRKQLMQFNPMYKIFRTVNDSSTLVSYYTNGNYYDTHTDFAIFTMIIWVYKEPKQFLGGELILESVVDNSKATIECLNNRAIIFPSCTPHKVVKVSMDNSNIGSGRFCITHFLNSIDKRPK